MASTPQQPTCRARDVHALAAGEVHQVELAHLCARQQQNVHVHASRVRTCARHAHMQGMQQSRAACPAQHQRQPAVLAAATDLDGVLQLRRQRRRRRDRLSAARPHAHAAAAARRRHQQAADVVRRHRRRRCGRRRVRAAAGGQRGRALFDDDDAHRVAAG
jgi:hypothetical protein